METKLFGENPRLFREDLRETFVCSFEYKTQRVEVYLIRKLYRKSLRSKKLVLNCWAVAYTSGTEKEDGTITYSKEGIVGVDSNHGWYKDDDSEQYKHIGNVIGQITSYIDEKK